mmetsp:Transcript_7572/g.11335  ORF Transcript_7572/g.11335 Transcript_7572/m.11335 type:complete len:221 (+) Transcript_7572:14-676(+)
MKNLISKFAAIPLLYLIAGTLSFQKQPNFIYQSRVSKSTFLNFSPNKALNDQKLKLVEIVAQNKGKRKNEVSEGTDEIEAIIKNLESKNKKFDEKMIDGQWMLIFIKETKKSDSAQQLLLRERSFGNFDISRKEAYTIQPIIGKKVQALVDLSYEIDGRRINIVITKALIKLGQILIPLPFKGRKGFLDVLFIDEDMRITKGNQGGIFVHVRPDRYEILQ